MEKCKKILRAVLFPHGIFLAVLVPSAAVLLIYSFVFPHVPEMVCYGAYTLSAYALTALCCKTPRIIAFFRHIKTENRHIARLIDDRRLRTNLSLFGSLVYSTAYAMFQMALGLRHRSVWFYAMAAYYALLALMRFYVLRYTRGHQPGEDMAAELRCCRFCGGALLVMNLALSVIIAYIVWQNRTFRHHEITTIAMAAFTFTSLTMAIVNLVRYRRQKSPAFFAAKAIGFASALVSLLTLETAMLTAFGTESEELFRQIMTGMTGLAVSLVILVMAAHMLLRSQKALKRTKARSSENHG